MSLSDLPFTLPTEGPLRLSPTDISHFIRLEQCDRFLRLMLFDRQHGRKFMYEHGLTPEELPPILTLSGQKWEQEVTKGIREGFRTQDFAAGRPKDGTDNERLAAALRDLPAGESLVILQPRLQMELDGWLLTGDADLVRAARDGAGLLSILVADAKSSAEVSVEYRLQVGFYHGMIERLLADQGVAHAPIRTGILYQGARAGSEPDDATKAERDRAAASLTLGLEDAFLELVEDPRAYLEAVADLVTGPNSRARRAAMTPFGELFFHLTYKCDGCLFNQLCLQRSAEEDDLSLIPHLSAADKGALQRVGVNTASEVASLKELVRVTGPSGTVTELQVLPEKEAACRRVATTWPVGPRLDELVHRARAYRKWRRDPVMALTFIPGKGHGSLPHVSGEQNPNLVRIYIDAQDDPLHKRVYLIGARVTACRGGNVERSETVVRMTAGPPDTVEKERDLVAEWARETLKTVVRLAFPDAEGRKRAPIHLIFFNSWEQRLLLEALSRHMTNILGAAPALYDFITQLSAFDSPVATFLDQEIREQKNLPMLCQPLQAIAARLGFDWHTPEPFTEIFRTRLFDHWKKVEDAGENPWITGKARFSSQIPAEYAYVAWGELPASDGKDPYAPYRQATPELLKRFQARRLEALEHVAGDCRGNALAEKRPFDLPDLAAFQDRAATLAQALHEFVLIERHVELGEWKAARHIAPERRVLMGETLLVRYREQDQAPEVVDRLREHVRRRALRERYRAAAREAKPEARSPRLSKEQREEVQSDLEGLRIRLRVDVGGVDCSLTEALGLCLFKEGERLALNPRLMRDDRPNARQDTPFTPTPKRMLYGQRVGLAAFDLARDAAGELTERLLVVEHSGTRGGASNGFSFGSFETDFVDGELYTLDPSPDNYYGQWCEKITRALADLGEEQAQTANTLYALLTNGARPAPDLLPATEAGQQRFLAGLDALEAAGHFHTLEPSKRDYIGGHGSAPLLLVQGPPGTGKSYGTAFALFARLQAALDDGREFRAFVTCKTHAATDVLLENIRAARLKLREFRERDPALFARYFDPRLLAVPLFRVAGREPPGEGVRSLPKDEARAAGEPKALDTLTGLSAWIAGATPGGIYGLVKNDLFGHRFCDWLVLDEASQMNLPEAVMAALPLRPAGQLIVVGDHRQMPPIVQHDWESEPRRTFQEYQAYQSLFEALLPPNLTPEPPIIRFEESFRLHADMAEFLRREVYYQDGIQYHSRQTATLASSLQSDPFVAAVLSPEYPIVVVLHDEAESQSSNVFEQMLIAPVLEALAAPEGMALDPEEGLGVVVPHRAQRGALQRAVPCLTRLNPATGAIERSAVDTVERFQGGERTVVLVSATESDREYLLASSKFLLDPRRLTVAASRAKQKLVLVASETVFQIFSPDEETFRNGQLWKNLLRRTCTRLLWEGEREGQRVQVWGNE